MSCQIKCGKCGILFDKEPCPRRKNDHYRSCKQCRDKMNNVSKKNKKPVKSEPLELERPNDFNWKEVVFGKSVSNDNEELNDERDSNESDPHNSEKSEESESKKESDDANSVKEEIIIRTGSTDDMPISSDDLQKQIQSKHVVTKPIVFDLSDNDKKELTVSEKLNKIIEMLESTASQLTKKADGYDTSTKCLLEKINSNVLNSRMVTNTPDTNFSAYEVKVDKLASRINELETNLKLFISTTIDIHKTSYNLKQCIIESEENLKNALQLIYNKI